MGQELRTYEEPSVLMKTLVWTDLVSDLEDPHHYVLDPSTGRRWKRLSLKQEYIAEEIIKGSNYREACKAAGVKTNPEAASAYVCGLLRDHAPFINHVIELCIKERQSKIVTKDSHLRRLDDLGRRAEKSGKYSAAIAAEVARGRVAGLYAKDMDPEDKKALNSIRDIDSRIKQLLGKMSNQEKELHGRLVSEQRQDDVD